MSDFIRLVVMIGIVTLIITSFLIMFTGLSGNKGTTIQIPAINTLSAYQHNVTVAANVIGNSVTQPTFQLQTCSVLDLACNLGNLLPGIADFFIFIVTLFVNLLIIGALVVGIIFLILFEVIPGIFGVLSVGPFQQFYNIITGIILTIVILAGAYVLYRIFSGRG